MDDYKKNIEFLETAIDSIADPIFVKDEDHNWVVVNKAFEDFLGHPKDKLLGKSDYDFFPKHEADVFWEKDNQVMASDEILENEETLTDADGNRNIIVTRKNAVTLKDGSKILVGCIRDITDLRRQQEVTMMQTRLAALGEMVGGIAHEINNPLAIIQGKLEIIVQLLNKEKQDPEKMLKHTHSAIDACARLAHNVVSMKKVARINSDDPLQSVTLNELFQNIETLTRDRSIRVGITIDFPKDTTQICKGRPSELLQVMINLLNNSLDAIEHLDDKWVRVNVENCKPGYVGIRFTDSGRGISKEVVDRIFEPYFTTKDVGKGTGLGLSISKKLMKTNGGDLDYEAKDGHTSFVISLQECEGE